MCEKKELSFSIFMLYSLIKCYDVLHTQGKEYLVEDITDYVREKGVNV